MTTKIILRDKAYIPTVDLSDEDLRRVRSLYSTSIYTEKACKLCDNLQYRHNEVCDSCDNFIGHYKFWKWAKGKSFIGVDIGDREKTKELFRSLFGSDFTLSDQRISIPMKSKKARFFEEVAYPYQIEAVDEWQGLGYGALESKPRTGKTVMAAMLTLRMKQRTLILAHQDDLIKQFYATFMNIKTAVPFTNIPELEEKYGRTIVKMCKKPADFNGPDICLATYQQFLSDNGRERLAKIKKEFGVVLIDELHRGNADEYSNILGQFHARTRLGMTATYDRKDRKEVIINHIIGPVVHKTEAEALTPLVTIVKTGFKPATKNYKIWTYAMRALENSKKRNALIVSAALHDLKKGRSILIPMTFHSHIVSIVDAINLEYGKDIAAGWHGKLKEKDRDGVLARAKSGKIRVTVAMRSMLTGVNIERWDTLYEVMPISNDPNFEQEYNRICTPSTNPKKKDPLIRLFVDDWGLSVRCFSTCWRKLKKDGVRFTSRANADAKEMLRTLSRRTVNVEDEDAIPSKRAHEPRRKDRKERKERPIGLLRNTVL